ncbi:MULTISPECIES: D-alanine--D-alanine ligase [unclassified Acinetobacter]|uniref:D-alanine--D-alanine ligase family protein n=1 Tax=unclassified Acinetobacter TaxID=196816 RepID=UPI0029348F70|nr:MULTISPECIES: D-alanine--D-alanine ligase [unclassified Acinetobacter]WOE33287.1 D-alanine--D-alanine ligase [Acinetobacter sp. SAAs470]WOE36935.1 D-alanine--D-alanine ligase [Acinetobacter sp. SAAs474]
MGNVTNNLKVAIICGGSSTESEVSRSSAKAVEKALKKTFSDVQVVELDSELPQKLINSKYDVVFPVLHGAIGEDGTIQGFLEILGLPYVGSGVKASACALHKPTAKLIFSSAGLLCALGITVCRGDGIEDVVNRILEKLGDDIVIKPCDQGSALGIEFAQGREEITLSIKKILNHNTEAVVEKRIIGREITIGVLEDSNRAKALPVVEVITPIGQWYDYEHRYTDGASQHIVPAKLSKDVYERASEIAIKAHQALGCKDLSRSDFIITYTSDIYLLETNTIPGMTPTSLYPDAAKAADITFDELVSQLVKTAILRGKR